jgi:peptidoglycan biosynthesis protein MviN/MurJ (putative lipid II flippase)
MIVSLLSIAGNYLANAMLVKQYGHQGLAMTASVMLTLNSFLLIAGMSSDGVQVDWKQVTKSGLTLLIGIIVTIQIHNLYHSELSAWSVGSILGLSESVLSHKLDSLARILIDASLIVLIFGGAGLTRLRKTPLEALKMLRRRK